MKLLFKKFKKTQAYKSFFISYTCFIVIAISFCCIIYSAAYHTLEGNNEKLYTSMLRHSNNVIMQCITMAEDITTQLNANPTGLAVLSGRNTDPNAQLDLTAQLQTYNADSYISEICLYSIQNDKMYSTQTMFKLKSMYGSFIKYGDMDYNEFCSEYLTKPIYNKVYHQQDMIVNGDKTNCLMYVASLPMWENKQIYGNLLIFIDTNKLLSSISETFNADSCFVYIYHNNNLLASTPNAPDIGGYPSESNVTEKIDGTEYMIFSGAHTNKYSYAVAIPEKLAMGQLITFRILIVALLILSFAVYIILAMILSNRNVKPLHAIIKRSGDAQSITNEYTQITDTLDRLTIDNKYFQKEYADMLPSMRSSFVSSLINGQITDHDQITELSTKLKLDFLSERYILLALSLQDTDNGHALDIAKATIAKEFLTSALFSKVNHIFCNTSISDMVTIICCGEHNNDDELIVIENMINDASNYLNKALQLRLKASFSEEFNSLSSVFFVYQATIDNFNNGIYTTFNNTIWCTPSGNIQLSYYYPIEMENKIIQEFKRNNLDRIYTVLDSIQEKNCEQYVPFGKNIFYLYYNIKSTIYKIFNTEGIEQEEKISSYLAMMDTDKTVAQFIELTKELFAYMIDLKNSEYSYADLSDQFLLFVNSKYHEPDFGRHTFAEKFHISDDYVSKIFKEYTGFQFHEYLTKLRMDSACTMLLEENYSVEKIALSIGYNSAVAFRRAFKAYTGMTPKEYKLKQQNTETK